MKNQYYLIIFIIFAVAIVCVVLNNARTIDDIKSDTVVVNKKNITQSNSGDWLMYKNEKYGITFEYPSYFQLEESEIINSNAGILFIISANYNDGDDNHLYITVNTKEGEGAGSDTGIENAIMLGNNIKIKKEINASDGKIMLSDGFGTMNYYFMQAYAKRDIYNYRFELSRENSSDEMLDVFEKMIASTSLAK